MESNKALNISNALEALHELTDTDLDALLQFDSPPLTLQLTQNANNDNQHEDFGSTQEQLGSIMDFNREPFPSQLNCGESFCLTQRQTEIPDYSRHLDLLTQTPATDSTCSLVITTQKVDQVIINDTELPLVEDEQPTVHKNEKQQQNSSSSLPSSYKNICNASMQFDIRPRIKQETLDLSLGLVPSSQRYDDMNTTFEQAFARYQADDFELPTFDVDMAQLMSTDQSRTTCNEVSTSLSSVKVLNFPHVRFQTQFDTNSKEQHTSKNISNSCPEMKRNNLISMLSDSAANNPNHFLTLDYGTATQTSTVCNEMNISNVETPSENIVDEAEIQLENPSNAGHSLLNCSQRIREPNHNREKNPSVQPCTQNYIGHNSVADITRIPMSVKQLYDVIKSQYSDFAFVYALSAQLCQNRVPMDCFVVLKMGLLLSLASIGSNPDRPPIPIVAIGNDTYMSNYLMTHVGQLAERFVGPTDDIKPPSSAGYRNHNWIDADPILLAKGGVFYVGDWSRLKMARADKLFKELEYSRIFIDKTTHVYPLVTAIWTHWRSFKYTAKDQQTFNKIVKIFGIPVYVENDNHDVLVNYILEQSSVRIFESTIDHLSVSIEDMRCYLAVIAQRTVDFTPEASELLQKYFVASRIERPDCLTKQAFVVLKQFAESFAKLAFRHEVILIDVVAAIYMCENFIQNVFGSSDNPPPSFEAYNFVGQVDAYLTQFQKWLESYVAKHYDK